MKPKIAPTRNRIINQMEQKIRNGSFKELPKISQNEDSWAPNNNHSPKVNSARKPKNNFFMTSPKISEANFY